MDRLPTPVFSGFPGGLDGKESACNAGDLGSISGLERSPGEGNSYPLQYSCLENATKSQHNWATFKGFPGGSVGKCGRPGFHPWVWKIPWRTHGNPLQNSCLENPHDQRNPAGCSSQGRKESDTTDQLSTAQQSWIKKELRSGMIQYLSTTFKRLGQRVLYACAEGYGGSKARS